MKTTTRQIREQKRYVKPTLLQRIKDSISRVLPHSIQIKSLKITFENTGAGHYHFGCTYLKSYKQFELNFGRYVLNFWYRK